MIIYTVINCPRPYFSS